MEQQENQAKETPTISAKELLWLCLSRWYLFVLALIITCGIAIYHIKKTSRVFEATASIIVKDNHSKTPDVSQAFSDIGVLNTNVNINNEMVQLKSPVIVREVAERLGLDVSYLVKEGLRTLHLYGRDLPVTVKFVDLGLNGNASMHLTFNGDSTVTIGPFARGDEKLDFDSKTEKINIDLRTQAGDTIGSEVGRLVVDVNPAYLGSPTAKTDILVKRIGVGGATGNLLANLSTDISDNYSSVINIRYRDTNVPRANDVLNELIKVYNENWIRDRNEISVSTSNFINERLAVIQSELGEVDSDISNYKSAHQLTDVGAASQAYFQQKLATESDIAALNNSLTLARQIKSHLTDIANSFKVLPASTGLNNIGIESLINEYNKQLVDRNNLVANSSETNPIVLRRDTELAGMRDAMLSAIDSYITTLNAEIRGKQAQGNASGSRLSATPSQARHLLTYERQQKVKEELYLYLLQKREENELSQAFTAYNTKLVMPPTVSGPVSPNERKIYSMAIAIGLLVPGALIFLIEVLNTKVRGRRDLDNLSIPFAGEIPTATNKRPSLLAKAFNIHTRKDYPTQIVVKHGNHNVINEAFRVIRTNLEFMLHSAPEGCKVIMLTSANVGSGKTFIVGNLGAVLALKGKRVAILDLDLRKATLSTLANKPHTGLSNYLAGSASADDIVVRNLDGTEGLDLYPVGIVPPNPSELLYSERLDTLVQRLRSEYDYIIIDCPPAEVVADAKIVNRLADLTLFVIRAGVLERSMLPEISEYYTQKRFGNMAVILNGTDDPTQSYYGGGRFGYAYGYGYGYGYYGSSDGKKGKRRHHSKKTDSEKEA